MERSQYKQNFYDKENRRRKRMKRMNSEQLENYSKNLLSRSQRKREVRERLIQIVSLEDNLALEDIRKKLDDMDRNTFNYWINVFEKDGWFKRKAIEGEGEEIRGRPKTLILNKKKINELENLSSKRWKSIQEYNLKSMLVEKLLDEIEKQPDSHKQLQEIIRLFKEDGGYGAKMIFLLYSDYIKIDYKLSVTDIGKKELQKIRKRK